MNPILRDVPFSFESERLLIRGPQAGDGAIIRPAVLESHDELKQWMPWAVNVPSEEEYEALVRQWHLDYLGRTELKMLLFEKESGHYIGSSGLHGIEWKVPQFEIGYWARTSCVGRGFITESTKAITDFAFEQLGAERVQIRVDTQNLKSVAIPKRLGYTLEGTLRKESRHHLTNELRDLFMFAKVRA